MKKLFQRFFYLLLLIVLGSFGAKGQERLELTRQLLEPLPDTARVSVYCQIALTYLPLNPDSAELWMEKVKPISQNNGWGEERTETLLQIIKAYKDQGLFDQSDRLCDYVLDHFDQHQSVPTQASCLRSKAFALAARGEIDSSLVAHAKLKRWLDSNTIEDTNKRLDCYANYYLSLSFVYSINDDGEMQLECCLAADSILQLGGSAYLKAYAEYYIGNALSERHEYRLSNHYYGMIDERVQQGQKNLPAASMYLNLGVNYMQLKDLDSARFFLDKSLAMGKNENDQIVIGFAHMIYGEIYEDEAQHLLANIEYDLAADEFLRINDQLNYNRARLSKVINCLAGDIELDACVPILDELLDYFEDREVIENLSQVYRCRAIVFHRTGRYQDVLREYEKYDSTNAIFREKTYNQQAADMQALHETNLHKREAAKQAEIAVLSQAESSRKTELLWVVGASAILLLLILITLLVVLKRLRDSKALIATQKASIETREHEKSMLLKELHHRVKNNLQVVASLLNLQRESVKDEVAKDAFQNGQNRVEAMAMIHRYLYNTDELTSLEVNHYLMRLVKSIAHSYGFTNGDAKLRFEITERPIDVDLAIPIGLITNELVSNAFKHAYTNVEQPELFVGLQADKDLILTVHDNGNGMASLELDQESNSFGIELVKSLARQLKAELVFDVDTGTKVQLIIPEAEVSARRSMTDENSTAGR